MGFYDQHTRARGFGLVLGTTVELPAGLSLGAVARPPVTHTVSGDWSDEYHEAIGQSIADYDKKKRTIEYDIESPWEIGVGLSWSSYVATVAADIWFVDWSQARYGGAPYIDDAVAAWMSSLLWKASSSPGSSDMWASIRSSIWE